MVAAAVSRLSLGAAMWSLYFPQVQLRLMPFREYELWKKSRKRKSRVLADFLQVTGYKSSKTLVRKLLHPLFR